MINEPQFFDDGISDSHIIEEYDYDEYLREIRFFWIKENKHDETNKKL